MGDPHPSCLSAPPKVLPCWVAGSPLLWYGLSWCPPPEGTQLLGTALASGNVPSLPPGEIFLLNSLQILLIGALVSCLPRLVHAADPGVGCLSGAFLCSDLLLFSGSCQKFSLSLMFLGFTIMCLGMGFFPLDMSSSPLCESIYNEIFPLVLANA